MLLQPIGEIRTPFKDPADMPVQPAAARGVPGRIELQAELLAGLVDLEGFSHLIALYHFHRQHHVGLTVTPFLGKQPHGLFATRAPCRPNPIGLSVLRLREVAGTSLLVEDVDMLDGTPLIDLKPYVPAFDQPSGEVRCGWLEEVAGDAVEWRSDERFCDM